MEETTTTVPQAGEVAGGQEESQPTTPTETAEAPTENTQTDPQGTDETVDASAETDEDTEWLKNKGIDPSDPEAIKKAAKLARDTEREFHKGRQEAKNLQKELPTQVEDFTDSTVVALQRDFTEMKFFVDYPEAKGREDELIAVGKDYPELAQNFNLKALWEIAKGRSAGTAVEAAKKEGREAAKAEIARASTAAAPSGNAAGVTPTEKKDPGLEAFNQAYEEY